MCFRLKLRTDLHMQIPLEKRCEVFRTPQSMIGKSTLRLNCVSARLMFPDDII